MAKDISESIPYNLSTTAVDDTFAPSDIAYDVSIDNIPFIVNVNQQQPYRRETAQYKKDQFDNSPEPGEQSLSGWWLRSQTSWHNGAGIKFYEPGTDYQHVSHRFDDSRGVDVWTIGEASLLPEVFHAYTGNNGINAASGNDGSTDCLVSGDNTGILKKIVLNGNSTATTGNYVKSATSYPDGHSGSNYPFISVTTDGSTYYAACSRCVHKGTIDTLASDAVFFKHSTTDTSGMFVKYTNGYVLLGVGRRIGVLDTTASATSGTHTTGAADSLSNYRDHINSSWVWNDASAGTDVVYVSGYAGNNSEIWQIKYDETSNSLGMADATLALNLPDGEIVNAIHFYLGHLVVGTNKGIRICPVNQYGYIALGPLTIETDYSVYGFTERGNYIYGATAATDGSYHNGILVRIDLGTGFDDGRFAYAYDLEYQSSNDANNSLCTEVYNIGDRLVMVIEEDSASGELQVEHTETKRSTGWIRTGIIRYNTIEDKYFRYINLQCTTGSGDSITVAVADSDGVETNTAVVSGSLSNSDIFLSNIQDPERQVSLKFTLTNSTEDQALPVLQSYQLKAMPAMRRQRLIQYPLSCYDTEMDRYNTIFGYSGRAMELISQLESLEETSKFVNIVDYRTDESFTAIIEEVRFTNESSPDKNSGGFGGLLQVTVRKI
jgi:hypothetical protein